MKSVSRGIIALLVVSAILLLSDLNNRHPVKKEIPPPEQVQSQAVAGKTYSLGLCYFAPEASNDEVLEGFWQRMEELGFKRDSNLMLRQAHANAEIANIAPILLNFDNMPLDLIMVNSTPCVTAALATVKNHPVAFTYCYDPLAAGAGESLTNHAPGITGIGSFPPLEKTIGFLFETLKDLKKVGTIYNSSEANSRKVVSVLRQIAGQKGFTLVEMTVVNTSEVLQAAQVLASKGVNVIYVPGDNTVRQGLDAVSKVCTDHSIPLITNHLPDVKKGAFAAMGSGWHGVGYHTADLVGRLLNGASTATTPIENYVNEQMVINEEKTRSLGLTIPDKYRTPEGLPPGVRFKMALVHYVDSHNSEDCEKGIRKVLEDNNLKENINFTLKVFNAQGDISTLNSIAGSIGNEEWDLILATSTPTIQLFAGKLPGHKIVFTNVGDPLAAGLGKSFEDHLPNICGISTMSDFDGLIRLVRFIHPGIKKVGTVFTPAEINSVAYKDRLNQAATAAGIQLLAVPANTATEVLDAANSLVSQKIGAFCQISDNLTGSSGSAILKVAKESKIPYYGFVTQQVSQGAVAVCARDYFQAGYEAGEMAIAVLSGQDPSRIPFRYVKKTVYLISEENAGWYGIPVNDRLKAEFPTLIIDKKSE